MLAALLLSRGLEELATALNNGIVQPPMGFSTWNHFGGANCTRFACEVVNLTQIADAMVANGLRDAGYTYVNLDDGWVNGRFPNGSIIADSKVFPHGVKAVADYLHSIEMKLGLYTSRGQTTCMHRTGSQDYEKVDMQQFADWQIDYVKVSCITLISSNGGVSSLTLLSVFRYGRLTRAGVTVRCHTTAFGTSTLCTAMPSTLPDGRYIFRYAIPSITTIPFRRCAKAVALRRQCGPVRIVCHAPFDRPCGRLHSKFVHVLRM